MHRDKKFLFCFFIFSAVIFSVHFFIVKKAVYGDGRYYYAYLPAILLQHTLNYSDAMRQIGAPYFLSPLGLPANIYPIGPAVAWAIPFLAAHGVLLLFHKADGINVVYQFFIGIWDIGLACMGLYFVLQTLRRFFPQNISYFTTFVVFMGTNLLFYGAVDVVNSHSISFFLSALFLFLWVGRQTRRNAFILGIVLGLLTLVRSQDILFIIFPLWTFIQKKGQYGMQLLLVGVAAMVVFLPQVFLWHAIWGTWLQNPYTRVAKFYFLSPNILGVLFNTSSGLLLWTPICFFALVGLVLFMRKHLALGIPMCIFFLMQLYLVSSWQIWWQGASYSGRMFISSLPLFAIGLAFLLSQKKFQKPLIVLFIFLSIVNPFVIIFFLKSS